VCRVDVRTGVDPDRQCIAQRPDRFGAR
jgi:hypothetical protein